VAGGGRRAIIIIAIILGAAAGIGCYTFVYAKGASYLTNDPAACANCHVMNEQFDGWMHSSHRAAAVCNDCHAPHDVVGKYLTKAINGFNHSLAFTTGYFPDPIRITERNRRITEQACRHCHAPIVAQIDSGHPADKVQSCIRCHSSVGHLH
jgi:cytochrome c nitrite reductase small subunit